MRKLSTEEEPKAEPPYGTGGVGPNADGFAIKEVSARTFAAGQEKKVPLMIGSNARERSLDGGAEALQKAVADLYGDLAPRAMEFYASLRPIRPMGTGERSSPVTP